MSRSSGFVVVVVALCASACVTRAGEGIRGVGAGLEVVPTLRDPTLTRAGAAVRVASAAPPTCRPIGFVTGVAGRDEPRRAGSLRPAWERELPRDEALDDARNLAGAGGADLVVVDAYELRERRYAEHRYRAFVLAHGRAFRCP